MNNICRYTVEQYIEKLVEFHSSLAPGLLIGGFMVDAAVRGVAEYEIFDALCESASCLPDAVQILTPCTVGNGWLKIVDTGRFAITLYDKTSGNGVRVSVDASKLDRYPEIKNWFMRLVPKREQDNDALFKEIREAGREILTIKRVTVLPALRGKRAVPPVVLCASCGEAYPHNGSPLCLACQGMELFSAASKSDDQGAASCLQVHQVGGSLARRAGDGMTRISFVEALAQTVEHTAPLGSEEVDLTQAGSRVAAQDLAALVDCPSVDASLKDGYAIHATDVAAASAQHPVQLRLAGLAVAGRAWTGTVQQGMAVRVLTGAPIPRGAEAVVSDEFTHLEGEILTVTNDAEAGRNILRQGSDVAAGQLIVATGELLRPTQVGLLAAAGHSRLRVFRRPRVAIVATGDEVVAPGHPLAEGKLYASNLVTLASWCAGYGMAVTTTVVPDNEDQIRAELRACFKDHDAILTSGGAWTSERDLVVHLLDELGWKKIYHGVRIGPGKPVGLGLWQGKPVFCLPGGPSSNHIAFLQLALPALHRLEGRTQPGLPVQVARLARPIQAQKEWTQFVHGRLERSSTGLVFHPLRRKSRLQEMAQMDAIVQIPEGTEWLEAGTMVPVQVLVPTLTWRE